MLKIEEKIYCIYQREWEILMAMAEIKNCFGMVFQEKQQEEEQVIHTLHQMVRKGMLSVDNEKMEIASDYTAWLENVKQAKKIFHFMQRQEEGWEHGVAYMGELVTIFTCSKTRKDAFDVRSVDKENWTSFFLEMELFPTYRTEGKSGECEEVIMEETKGCDMMFVKNITTIVAEIDIEKKQETGWFAFGEEEGKQFLLYQKEATKKTPYTMEALKKILA